MKQDTETRRMATFAHPLANGVNRSQPEPLQPQQPAPLISTLLTTRTFLSEYVIVGGLTLSKQEVCSGPKQALTVIGCAHESASISCTQCHGTTVFVRPFSIPSTVVLWQPLGG